MNVFRARNGGKVVYNHPESGSRFDKKQAAEFLTVGEIYTIANVNMHGFSTDIYLEEFPATRFNSVIFDDVGVEMEKSTIAV